MTSSAPAKPSQEKKFKERRTAQQKTILVNEHSFIALPNVYDTSTDTELMADSVSIENNQSFLEIGCGTGVVTILVALKAKSGLGVDINNQAVVNANLNKKLHKADNVEFIRSNIFEKVYDTFDVIICNPPYNEYTPSDEVEMMFWDEKNRMKIAFFKQVPDYLKDGGKVYFGWADFGDLDQELPLNLAEQAGLSFVKRYELLRDRGDRTFYVYEFEKLT